MTRYELWRNGWVKQHQPSRLKEWLKDVFEFSAIKYGETEKGQGDIVIVNLKTPDCFDFDLKEYLKHTHNFERIETNGIYTNLYYGKKFYIEMLKSI